MSTHVRIFISHNTFKSLKTYFSRASLCLIYFLRNRDIVYGNVIINDMVCAQFVTAL